MPFERARQATRVGIHQQLVPVEAQAMPRFVTTIYAVGVQQARSGAGHVAVPHAIGAVRHCEPRFMSPRRVEHAELDALRVAGIHRELDAASVEVRPEGVRSRRLQAFGRLRHLAHSWCSLHWGPGTVLAPAMPETCNDLAKI